MIIRGPVLDRGIRERAGLAQSPATRAMTRGFFFGGLMIEEIEVSSVGVECRARLRLRCGDYRLLKSGDELKSP